MNLQEQKLNELSGILKTPKAEIIEKVSSLIRDKKSLDDELTEAKKKLLLLDPNMKISKLAKVTLIEKFIEGVDVKDLRNFVEHMRQEKADSIIVAGSILNGKTSLIIGVHKNLVAEFDAAGLTRKANEVASGQGGGGRRELAQAGGFDFSKVGEISKYIRGAVSNKDNK